MGLFNFLSRKTPEQIEENADRLFEQSAFGQAKIDYEKALERLNRINIPNPSLEAGIKKKILRAKEALAAQHRARGEKLLQRGCTKDAEELLTLALELTETELLQNEIKTLLSKNSDPGTSENDAHEPALPIPESEQENFFTETDQEFSDTDMDMDKEFVEALLNTLPEKLQTTYRSYGETFLTGYIQMNQGNFRQASKTLTTAMGQQKNQKNLIALELATCHLNLDEPETARDLLLFSFLENFPDSSRGYELLCEALWQLNEFDQAHNILSQAQPSFTGSPLYCLLWGETFFKAGKLQEAETWYMDTLSDNAQDHQILLALARTVDAMGDHKRAMGLYRSLLNNCASCGVRPDPFLRKSYADACLKSGEATTQLLDIYFGLVSEVPESRAELYKKISTVYTAMGEEEEAQRFMTQAEALL